MSLSLTPPGIPTFTPADYQDNDTYGEDCTTEMLARQTTILAAAFATISRQDGVATGANDMQISNVTVFAGGLKYAWKGQGGIPGVVYLIRFQLTLVSTDVIYRTVCVPVPQFVG